MRSKTYLQYSTDLQWMKPKNINILTLSLAICEYRFTYLFILSWWCGTIIKLDILIIISFWISRINLDVTFILTLLVRAHLENCCVLLQKYYSGIVIPTWLLRIWILLTPNLWGKVAEWERNCFKVTTWMHAFLENRFSINGMVQHFSIYHTTFCINQCDLLWFLNYREMTDCSCVNQKL